MRVAGDSFRIFFSALGNEAELLHSVDERFATDVKIASRVRLMPIMFL